MSDDTLAMIYRDVREWRGEWIKLLRWIRALPEVPA